MKKKLLSYRWSELCTSAYLMLMFLAFPLYFQNNYINILEAKTSFFTIITVIYLIAELVLIWLESVIEAELRKKKHIKKMQSEKREHLKTAQNLFFQLFLFAVIISTLVSGDIKNAWYSPDGKLFGTRIILLCCGVFIFVSKKYRANKFVTGSLILGCGAVFVLAILNRYGIDPLGVYSNLVEEQKDIYISTIGNVNILSGFICVFLPLFNGMFLYSKQNSLKIMYGILVWLGIMAGISTNSDSFFLGFGASMLFYLWHSMEKKEMLFQYLLLCMIIVGAITGLKGLNSISDFQYVWETLQSYLLNEVSWLSILVLLLICVCGLSRIKKDIDYKKLRTLVFGFLGMVLMISVFYVIKINITGHKESFFLFSDSWGTNRGFVWKRTCILFEELPLHKKIIGIGPGGFKEFLSGYNREIRPFTDPHSEILYYLVSTGVMGLTGYLGMIISMIIACLKKRNELYLVFVAVFLSWLAQGTVNTSLVFTTPYLFIFMGICQYKLKEQC